MTEQKLFYIEQQPLSIAFSKRRILIASEILFENQVIKNITASSALKVLKETDSFLEDLMAVTFPVITKLSNAQKGLEQLSSLFGNNKIFYVENGSPAAVLLNLPDSMLKLQQKLSNLHNKLLTMTL